MVVPAADAAQQFRGAVDGDDDADRSDEDFAERPVEDAGGPQLRFVAVRAAAAPDQTEGLEPQGAVDAAANGVPDPGHESPGRCAVAIGVRERVEQTPGRVTAEPDGEDDQQCASERLGQQDPQRAARIGDRAAALGNRQDREHADDAVDDRLRGVPQSRKVLHHVDRG
ncbi:hypothetical protein D3C83_21480 [compost metagenome]